MTDRGDRGAAGPQPIPPDPERVERLERATESFRWKRLEKPHAPWHRRVAFSIADQFREYYMHEVPPWRVALRQINVRDRVIPTFACIGAIRSGTSALSQHVFQHPCIVLPLAKEVHGFRHADILSQMPTHRQLEPIRRKHGVAVTGYSTPVIPLLVWPFAARAMNPSLRTVVILRDPVERTISHWQWEHHKLVSVGLADDPFWACIPKLPERVRIEIEVLRGGGVGFPTVSGQGGGILEQSIYAPFLKVLFDVMNRERILVLNARDFYADPIRIAKQIYAFLELPPFEPIESREKNATPPVPGLDCDLDAVRASLRDFFKPHNDALFELIGTDWGW